MSDPIKPLEWVELHTGYAAECGTLGYIVWHNGVAWWSTTGHWQDVPGTGIGTPLATAKAACEEHRRKMMEDAK